VDFSALVAQARGMASPSDHDPPAGPSQRQFGWWDMFVSPGEDPRGNGPAGSGERAVLTAYLRDYRLTLELKCAGLDQDAMACRSVPPSNLSLLGLVRHLAETERSWFRRTMAGQDAPRLYRTAERPNADFDDAVPDPAVVARAWAAWRAEIAFADDFVARASDLGVTGDHGEGPIALREVLVHMIEEYARHCGHADFLRERIDGRVGQ
jgi:uncharacterized damage-inducible protein DinB